MRIITRSKTKVKRQISPLSKKKRRNGFYDHNAAQGHTEKKFEAF
jgi:hypothetical protein